MSTITQWIDRTFYGKFDARWDNKLLHDMIEPLVNKDAIILDLGAGRGANDDLNFKGCCATVVGVDPSSVVLDNPYLDDAKVQEVPL